MNIQTNLLAKGFTAGRPSGIHNIIIHHMAGVMTAGACRNSLASRGVSAHYAVGSDGVVLNMVKESDQSWASGDGVNNGSKGNCKGISIETSNSGGAPNWPVSDATFALLVELVRDIATRNNLLPLKVGSNLFGHRDCSATACPGPYLYPKLQELADKVNAGASTPGPSPTSTPTPPANNSDVSKYLPSRGHWQRGDTNARVGSFSAFLYKTFPAYVPKAATGNFFGPNLEKAVKEFQRRAKQAGVYNDIDDGKIGPKTVRAFIHYGFKG